MGFGIKAINATAQDWAKVVRKLAYDGKVTGAKDKIADCNHLFLKPNGGVDVQKITDEFIKRGVAGGLCDENGVYTQKGTKMIVKMLRQAGLKTSATLKQFVDRVNGGR